MPTDEDRVAAAILARGRADLEDAGGETPDTVDSEPLLVSEAVWAETETNQTLEILGAATPCRTTLGAAGEVAMSGVPTEPKRGECA